MSDSSGDGVTLLANRLGALSIALSDLMRDALPEEISPDGPDSAALNTVMQLPRVRIDELAAILGMSHSGAVRVVDRLVKQGLIARSPHPDDARAVGISVTKRGQRLADALQEQRLQSLVRLVKALPKSAQGPLASTIEELLRILADDTGTANRICRLCEERICTPAICPTEEWARRNEQRKQWRSV